MLVLARKAGQTIHIAEGIVVRVIRIKGSSVRLGIQAPADVQVLRGELTVAAEKDGSPADSRAEDRPQERPNAPSNADPEDDGARLCESRRRPPGAERLERLPARHAAASATGNPCRGDSGTSAAKRPHRPEPNRAARGQAPRFWRRPPQHARAVSLGRPPLG